MSQNSATSAWSDEYCDENGDYVLESVAQRTDTTSEEVADMSSSKLTHSSSEDSNNSFVGKFRSNVTNIISKLFQRSPKGGATSSKYSTPQRGANIDGVAKEVGVQPIEQRKRKYSPNLSTFEGDSPSAEMISKRSRPNVDNDVVDETDRRGRSLTQQFSHSSEAGTSNFSYRRKSNSMVRRRHELCRNKIRAMTTFKATTVTDQDQQGNITRDSPVESQGDSQFDSGVPRMTPWSKPVHVVRNARSGWIWQREGSETSETEDELQRTTNTPNKEYDKDSVDDYQQQQQVQQEDELCQSGSDSASEIYLPFGGDLVKWEAAKRAASDPSRRYTSFLGNSFARMRGMGASTDNVRFLSLRERQSILSSQGYTNERPAFNPSVYGNNSSLRSTPGPSRSVCYASPFYDGATCYGGASATRPYRSIFTDNHLAVGTTAKATSSTKATPDDRTELVFTNQARAIINILDKFDSASTEVGNVAREHTENGEDMQRQIHSLYSNLGSSYTQVNKATQRMRFPSLQNELRVPQIPQLLKLKLQIKKDAESAQQAAEAKSSSIARMPVEYVLPTQDSMHKKTTEMQCKSVNRVLSEVSVKGRDMYSPAVPLALPNIKFPELTSYPKIQLNQPYSSSGVGSGVQSSPTERTSGFATTINTVSEECASSDMGSRNRFSSLSNVTDANTVRDMEKDQLFVFCAPQVLEQATIRADIFSPLQYTFDTPEVLHENLSIDERPSTATTTSITATTKTPLSFQQIMASAAAGDKWECWVCMIRNETNLSKCAACDSPKPKTTVNASSVTSNQPTPTLPTATNAPLSFKEIMTSAAAGDKWECGVCMIRNKANSPKCAACESPKPKTTVKASSVTSNQPMPTLATVTNAPLSFKEIMTSAAAGDKWECGVCMIRNEANSPKCAACESPKPKTTVKASSVTSNQPTPTLATVTNAPLSFKEIMSSATAGDKWECGVCMIRNKANSPKCAACESLKPTTAAEASTTTNNLLTPTLATIPKAPLSFQEIKASTSAGNKWECGVCMIRNDANLSKCSACENPKPRTATKASSVKNNQTTTKLARVTKAPLSFRENVTSTEGGNKRECAVGMNRDGRKGRKVIDAGNVPATDDTVILISDDSDDVDSIGEELSSTKQFSSHPLTDSKFGEWPSRKKTVRNSQRSKAATSFASASSPSDKVDQNQSSAVGGTSSSHPQAFGNPSASALKGSSFAFGMPARTTTASPSSGINSFSNGLTNGDDPAVEVKANGFNNGAQNTPEPPSSNGLGFGGFAFSPANACPGVTANELGSDTDVSMTVMNNTNNNFASASGDFRMQQDVSFAVDSATFADSQPQQVPSVAPQKKSETNHTDFSVTVHPAPASAAPVFTKDLNFSSSSNSACVVTNNVHQQPVAINRFNDGAASTRMKRPLDDATFTNNPYGSNSTTTAGVIGGVKPFAFTGGMLPNFNFTGTAVTEPTEGNGRKEPSNPVFQFGGLSQSNPGGNVAIGTYDAIGTRDEIPKRLKLKATRRLHR